MLVESGLHDDMSSFLRQLQDTLDAMLKNGLPQPVRLWHLRELLHAAMPCDTLTLLATTFHWLVAVDRSWHSWPSPLLGADVDRP